MSFDVLLKATFAILDIKYLIVDLISSESTMCHVIKVVWSQSLKPIFHASVTLSS